MARIAKAAKNLQVFRGGLARPDIFAQNAGADCCGSEAEAQPDRLASRIRFDNALSHSNPTGANDKWSFSTGLFAHDKAAIIQHINEHGVGATLSVLTIPTYAFVTDVAVYIRASEPGLTFDLITRNGLILPTEQLIEVTTTGGSCEATRTQAVGDYLAFGTLTGGAEQVIIGRDADGMFSLEADEIILRVATMPAGGVLVTGLFDLTVAVNYNVVHRAEI